MQTPPFFTLSLEMLYELLDGMGLLSIIKGFGLFALAITLLRMMMGDGFVTVLDFPERKEVQVTREYKPRPPRRELIEDECQYCGGALGYKIRTCTQCGGSTPRKGFYR